MRIKSSRGFSLVELMVALVLSGLAMAGIYRGYVAIVVANDVQAAAIELNQVLRIGLKRLTDELRMAGYNPFDSTPAPTLDSASNSTSISFSGDFDDDALTPYGTISYQWDGYGTDLVRSADGGPAQVVIPNVDGFSFVYLDSGGNVILPPPPNTTPVVNTVQIAIVARTTNPDFSFTDTTAYANQQGTQILAAKNDHFHRRLLLTEVQCRNIY